MITFKSIHDKLEKLGWPEDAFVGPNVFTLMRSSPPSYGMIPVQVDALGEYFWFLRTRIRPKTREIPTLAFDEGE